VDPGVHVLQIDLTPTDTSTSPKFVHALLISLILNDSKTDGHNNTAMTQHTSPIQYFHTDAIQKRNQLLYLIHRIYTSPKVQAFLPANSQKRSLKVPRFLAFSLFLSSILLQQTLNYPSDAAEDPKHS